MQRLETHPREEDVDMHEEDSQVETEAAGAVMPANTRESCGCQKLTEARKPPSSQSSCDRRLIRSAILLRGSNVLILILQEWLNIMGVNP